MSKFVRLGQRVRWIPRGWVGSGALVVIFACVGHGISFGQVKLGDKDYRFRIGDRILLSVPDRPSLNREMVIDETGAITIPLVGGVAVAGLNAQEMKIKVYQALRDLYPTLKEEDIAVEAALGQTVYVAGEVSRPGTYSFADPPNLWDAIREAGGPTGAAALDAVRIVEDEVEGGNARVVNVMEALESGNVEKLPKLKNGDTVVVSSIEDKYIGVFGVNVFGAVMKPGFYRLEGGHQDLMSAILLAGGVDRRAKLSKVQIIRHSEDGTTDTQEVDLRGYFKKGDLAKNPRLQPGDTVNVPEQNAWWFSFKNNAGLIVSLVATTASIIVLVDRLRN